MTLAQALRTWWDTRTEVSGEYPAGTSTKPSNWLISTLGGGETAAGVTVDERVAEGLPAIYACIHVISETIGALPLKLYRRSDNGRNKDVDQAHPLYLLLHDLPNPEMVAQVFREMLTRHLALWGRAYAYIERDRRGGMPVALWPLHPARMFVDRDALNRKRWQYWMGKGEYREWVLTNPDRPDILHLHINSEDGLDGRSPILINRESLGITRAADQYVGSWFGNGAIPGMVLTHPGRLKGEAKENLRRQWLEKFMGASKANKMAILEEGVTVSVVGVDPQKSQLQELRSAQIEAAARIYRVPLFLIQNQTKDTSWGSGIEQQMLGFVNLTLMPWLIQWQQVIARDLLSRQSFYSHEAAFVVNALVRGDLATRVQAYASAKQNGWMNGDEVRELENLNPLEDGLGQIYWMPANMTPMITGAAAVLEPSASPAMPAASAGLATEAIDGETVN